MAMYMDFIHLNQMEICLAFAQLFFLGMRGNQPLVINLLPSLVYVRHTNIKFSTKLAYQNWHERMKDPCSDPEFELHNHIDYARQSCFSALGS